MLQDTKQTAESLLRSIELNQSRIDALINEHGHGCRPAYVSEELCYYGERVERYKVELKELQGEAL